MNRRLPSSTAVAVLVGAVVATGCGSGDKASSGPNPPRAQTTAPAATTAATGAYNPQIDPARFGADVNNPYFPLKSGTTMVLKGSKDGTPQTHVTRITRRTRTIMGIPCVVVKDVVTDPNGIAEIAYD